MIKHFSKLSTTLALTGGLGLAWLTGPAWADSQLDDNLNKLQHAWVIANYQTPDNAKEAAFKQLTEEAHQLVVNSQNAPEAQVWEAITLSGYAKAKGGLGALKLVEKSRDLLLGVEKTQPDIMQGSVYTSLGTLYYRVPGWPIGFGDKKKAKSYLEKALQINPAGVDANYFYADYLSESGEYKKAIEYYRKALDAPARPGRADADAERKKEAQQGLAIAQAH